MCNIFKELEKIQLKFVSLKKDSLVQSLIKNNVPSNQLLLVEEILADAQKKSLKGNRYTYI